MSGFGCLPPPDNRHIQKYPLAARLAIGEPIIGPMVAGMLWRESFSKPEKRADGTYWIGVGSPSGWGNAIGGHAICLIPENTRDIKDGWQRYNQGNTSQCVAYASNRMQAINNRTKNLAPEPFYARCKELDGFAGDGTYIRVAMDVLRKEGAWRTNVYGMTKLYPNQGISENRWATSPDEILTVLGASGTGRVAIVNSWGMSYPHVVYMPIESVAYLMSNPREYFEATIVTDKPGG